MKYPHHNVSQMKGMKMFKKTIFLMLSVLLFSVSFSALATNAENDCLFNWGEKNYPEFFSPPGSATVFDSSNGNYYRQYAGTNIDLGVSAGNQLFVSGPVFGGLLILGDVAPWVAQAGCKIESVVTSNPRFFCYNPYQYIVENYVVVGFNISNQTSYPISAIWFDAELIVSTAAVPSIVKQTITYDIPGGLAAGGSLSLNLEPNMFSSFATKAKPFCGNASATLSLKITSATDGTGKVHTY